jgi:hypothetical protein
MTTTRPSRDTLATWHAHGCHSRCQAHTSIATLTSPPTPYPGQTKQIETHGPGSARVSIPLDGGKREGPYRSCVLLFCLVLQRLVADNPLELHIQLIAGGHHVLVVDHLDEGLRTHNMLLLANASKHVVCINACRRFGAWITCPHNQLHMQLHANGVARLLAQNHT